MVVGFEIESCFSSFSGGGGMNYLYGFLAVLGAIVSWGFFGVPMKFRSVVNANVDPMVFQIYFSISVFLSSWLVLIYNDFFYTTWGLVGASLWVPSSVFSIYAVRLLGLGVAQGVWSGLSIVFSFIIGTIAFSETPCFVPVAVLGLIILVIGVLGISLTSVDLWSPLIARFRKTDYSPLEIETFATEGQSPVLNDDPVVDEAHKAPSKWRAALRIVAGFGCTFALGCLNSSMLVPLKLVPEKHQGIGYVVSFGIGVGVITPLYAVVYFLVKSVFITRELPQFHVRVALIPGLVTGLLWSIGNFLSIYATLYLGFNVGFPLTQSALLVAGILGITVYREIKGWPALTQFVLSAGILILGAVLLGLFGASANK